MRIHRFVERKQRHRPYSFDGMIRRVRQLLDRERCIGIMHGGIRALEAWMFEDFTGKCESRRPDINAIVKAG